jgi:hypothetical protein
MWLTGMSTLTKCHPGFLGAQLLDGPEPDLAKLLGKTSLYYVFYAFYVSHSMCGGFIFHNWGPSP